MPFRLNALTLAAAITFTACSLSPSASPPTAAEVPLSPTVPPPTEAFTPAEEAPSAVRTEYTPTDQNFPNPERGFSSEVDFDDPDYSQYYEDGVTLVYATFRLDDYVESELPPDFLQYVDSWFDLARSGGVKAILRFSYNDGPFPFPDPDADLDTILRHVEQLTPILQKNADAIAWLEAGFIGAWGEWHTSTNGLDDDPEAKRKILLALLEAMPQDRSVLLRYPSDIMTNFPQPLSKAAAFDGSAQARVGFHNDCFLSTGDDENTYGRGKYTQEQEMEYLAQTTLFVPVGGESCAYNPPRSDCPTALAEMERFHFDEIGDGWYPETLDAWQRQGCYVEMEKRLGYRLSLVSAAWNKSAAPGGRLNLSVELENGGFSPIKNPRPVYLVLDGESRREVLLPVDPRFWFPGETSSFDARLRLPADMPEGVYTLALWLPDAYPSLRSDPRYAVRFANQDVWNEENGYNVLGSVTVDSQAAGDIDPSAGELIVLP